MSKAIAIARREIQERALVLLIAAAIAAAPFLALLSPAGTLSGRLEVVLILGTILGVAFVLGLSMLLGTSIVGRESREKRLSFYFARPVGGSVIWYGKVIASVFLLIVSAVIVFLPPMLISRQPLQPRGLWSLSYAALIGIVLAVGFSVMLFVNASSAMLRSRSPLVAADFVAAAAFVLAVGSLLVPVMLHFAVGLWSVLVLGTAITVVIALLFAGGWQLSRGRTDIRRGHRALSAFLWSALAIVLGLLGVTTLWIRAVGPNDLVSRHAAQIGGGSTVLIGGPARHRLDYAAAFLADVATGRVVQVSPFTEWNITASANGQKVAWFEPRPREVFHQSLTLGFFRGGGVFNLMIAGIDGKPIDTGIEIDRNPQAIVLSDDASRVAVLASGMLSIYDLASRKSLGSARIQGDAWTSRVQFLTRDEVRVYSGTFGQNGRINAWSYSIPRRTLKAVLDQPSAMRWFHSEPSADGKRLLLRTNREVGKGLGPRSTMLLQVFDLTSSRMTAEVPDSGFGWLFSDGRLAALSTREGTPKLKVLDASGTTLREIALPGGKVARFVGEIEPNVLAVATAPNSSGNGKGWTLSRVDVSSGAVSPITTGVAPIIKFPFGIDSTPARPSLQKPMLDEKGSVVVVDLRTGVRRMLI